MRDFTGLLKFAGVSDSLSLASQGSVLQKTPYFGYSLYRQPSAPEPGKVGTFPMVDVGAPAMERVPFSRRHPKLSRLGERAAAKVSLFGANPGIAYVRHF